MNNITDAEYIILENLYLQNNNDSPRLSLKQHSLKQRDFALLARTSLGMTNSILKRMVKKGWIKAKKINSRNIRYAITIEGINEIFKRSYSYFKRTIKNVAYYRDAINEIIQQAANNKKTILLIGSSDLDFIIEHLCAIYGLSFIKSADINFLSGGIDDNTFVFYSENIPYSSKLNSADCFFISQMLLTIKAAS